MLKPASHHTAPSAPDARRRKLQAISEQIRQGSYLTDQVIEAAIDNIIKKHLTSISNPGDAPHRRGFPWMQPDPTRPTHRDPAPPEPNIGVRAIHRVSLRTSDLTRSIDFYRRLTQTEPTLCNQFAIFHLAGFDLYLLSTAPSDPQSPGGFDAPAPCREETLKAPGFEPMCLSFEVEDLPTAYEYLAGRGVRFEGPWRELTDPDNTDRLCRGTRIAYLRGPDGEPLQLIQPAGVFARESDAALS